VGAGSSSAEGRRSGGGAAIAPEPTPVICTRQI
jgi:hypothetical protein